MWKIADITPWDGSSWKPAPHGSIAVGAVFARDPGTGSWGRTSEAGYIWLPASFVVLGPDPEWCGQDIWETIILAAVDVPFEQEKVPPHRAGGIMMGRKRVAAIMCADHFLRNGREDYGNLVMTSPYDIHGRIAVARLNLETNRKDATGAPLPDRNAIDAFLDPRSPKFRELFRSLRESETLPIMLAAFEDMLAERPRPGAQYSPASVTASVAAQPAASAFASQPSTVQSGGFVIDDDIPF